MTNAIIALGEGVVGTVAALSASGRPAGLDAGCGADRRRPGRRLSRIMYALFCYLLSALAVFGVWASVDTSVVTRT
jgi:hypothetical protein